MSGAVFDRLRVVLTDPSEPGNVGSTARAMMNMGLRRLVIVPDRVEAGALLGPEAHRLASGASEVLEGARVAHDLTDALAGATFAAAATARPRARLPVHTVEELEGAVLPVLEAGGEAALLFGPEDRGLTNEQLDRCQCVVTIPADPAHPSLNLAQAVLLCCYEATRSARRDLHRPAPPPVDAAPAEEREEMYRQMERILLEIGYLNPTAPRHIMGDLRRLVDRSGPTSREVTLLRGIWSQVEWAARRGGGGQG